jgi:hypothetical protein
VRAIRVSGFVIYVSLTLMFGSIIGSILGPGAAPALAADVPPIVGDWEGTLDPGAQPKKRVVVHISAAEDGSLSGTIDYPDQDTSGIAITAITYQKAVLHFESSPNLSIYDGTMNKDYSEITGTWKQGGSGLSLSLKRTR